MNNPLRYLRDSEGNPLLENGKKQYNRPIVLGFNPTTSPNRRKRRFLMQKNARNPLFGIHLGRYIQLVPETIKDEEGLVTKLGRILSKTRRGYSFTGKVKVIDHYPYKTR